MPLTHGYKHFKLTGLNQERRDVRVQFEDGTLAFIEVAEVVRTDSAKFSSTLNCLSQKIREKVPSDT